MSDVKNHKLASVCCRLRRDNAQSITGCGGQRVNFKNLNYRIPVNAIVILREVERGAVALLEYRHLPT